MAGMAVRLKTPDMPNKRLYNGGSEWQDDFAGQLGWHSTPFREYDPALGRFHGTDPLADQFVTFSPYHYAYNNPIMYNDPMGAEPEPIKEYYNPYQRVSLLDEAVFRTSGGWWPGRDYGGTNIGGMMYGGMMAGNAERSGAWGITGEQHVILEKLKEEGKDADYHNGQVGYWAWVDGNSYSGQTGTTLTNFDGELVWMTNAEVNVGSKLMMISVGGIGTRHLATAGVIALSDGPEPFIMDLAAGAYLTYVWWVHGGRDLIDKMTREIDRILTKAKGKQGFTYQLQVNVPGTYIDVRGMPVTLNTGDVWKFGQTAGTRYTPNQLATMIPGGVKQILLYSGNQVEIKVYEKYLIYGYFFTHGSLPPGNKIFR